MIEAREPEHPADEDFVLDYYGELPAGDRAHVRAHLASCARCQLADRDVRAFLRLIDVAPSPEPPPGFEAEMWARIEPLIRPPTASAGWRRVREAVPGLRRRGAGHERQRWWTTMAWAGGVVAAVVVAFVAGRSAGPAAVRPKPTTPTPASFAQARERVLDAEVEDHFERSQRVLTELLNSESPPPVTLASDQARAADLVAAGRVYRRSADTLGDVATSELLEDLERVLLDVANAPPKPSAAELQELRQRIDEQDLVFRLRVVGAELRRRHPVATAAF